MGKNDIKKCTKLVNIIKKFHDRDESIHEFDLIDEAGMEVSSFNAIKAYFLHRFDAHIIYDKKTKMYSILVVPVEQQQKLDDLLAGN